MNKIASVLALASAMTVAEQAQAREVTFTTQLKNYGGDGAYVVIYLLDSAGQYKGTLWMAGGRPRYYRHLTDWRRASGGNLGEIDGITGASVGSGRTLAIKADLADALIDAGYQIRIDTAVENMSENPADVTVPFTTKRAGKPVSGHGYVRSFSYTM